MIFYRILFSLYFILFVKDIDCKYYETFISNNSSKKAYSSIDIPIKVLNGGSVFNNDNKEDIKDDKHDSIYKIISNDMSDGIISINNTASGWAPGDVVSSIMDNQCGNTNYDTSLHNCLLNLAENRKDLCHHCKYIKIKREYDDGFGTLKKCNIEAMCYNRQCKLVPTYLYGIHAKNLVSSCKVCENGKLGMYDCKWGALANVCTDDYDDNFVDDVQLSM